MGTFIYGLRKAYLRRIDYMEGNDDTEMAQSNQNGSHRVVQSLIRICVRLWKGVREGLSVLALITHKWLGIALPLRFTS